MIPLTYTPQRPNQASTIPSRLPHSYSKVAPTQKPLPPIKTNQKQANNEKGRKHLPFKAFWRNRYDVESSNQHGLKHFFIACIVIAVIFSALYSINLPGNVLNDRGFNPDRVLTNLGNLYIPYCQSGSIYNGTWSFAGIDIQFGRLTFGQAKAADVAWNWVIGRGVQGFLVFVSYRVFTDALIRAAEASHVPYGIFTSLALLSTKTETLEHLLRGIFRIPGWRVKFMMTWLFISTGYLAFFPSFLDLMTGYDASNITQLMLLHNATVAITDAFFADIEGSDNNGFFFLGSYNDASDCFNTYWWDETLNTSWHRQHFNCDDEYHIGLPENLQNFYMALPSSYECTIEQNVYHWGFSAEWLRIFVYVTSAWLFGLWIVWIDADHNSTFCRAGRHMGLYRAILDISEAIREDLGPDLCAYSEQELAAAVKKLDPLKYYVSDTGEGQVAHIGLSSRKSEKVKLRWDQKYGRS